MLVYKYKGLVYFSLKDCLRALPKIKLLTINHIPNEVLRQLGITEMQVDDEALCKIIPKQKEKVRQACNVLLAQCEKYVQPNYPIEQLDLDNVIEYRKYLAKYINQEDYWKTLPMSLEEWTYDDGGLYF